MSEAVPSVYVTSVMEDTADYRAAARRAIEAVGLRPLMLEDVPPGTEPQNLKMLAEADAIVVIVGQRYGVVPVGQPNNEMKSMVWIECEEARRKGKPVFAFVLERDVTDPNVSRFRQWLKEAGVINIFRPDSLGADIRFVLSSWRERADEPSPVVEDIVHSLIDGGDDERFDQWDRIASLTAPDQVALQARLIRELTETFSPRAEYPKRSPTAASEIRGWLISALCHLPREANATEALARHLDPAYETEEMVRYWALANLYWKRRVQQQRVVQIAESDPSDLVRALATAILAKGSPEYLSRMLGVLDQGGEFRQVWVVLMALRAVPLSGALMPLIALIERNPSPAILYDVFLVLTRPPLLDPAAEALKVRFPPEQLVKLLQAAGHGAGKHKIKRFSYLLQRIQPGLGVEPEPAAPPPPLSPLPTGLPRLEAVYRAVLKQPGQFELLESFSPPKLRELADTADPSPPNPNQLWAAWMSIVQSSKLEQQ